MRRLNALLGVLVVGAFLQAAAPSAYAEPTSPPAPAPAAVDASLAPGPGDADAVPRVRGALGDLPAESPLAPRPAPVPILPAELFTPDARLPLFAWPEARFQKRFGLWELDLRGSSTAATESAPWLHGVPASSAEVSLTWRYHGLMRGVVRPVVGVAAFATQAYLPPHWSLRNDPLWSAGVAPNAGVEVVYQGVGVGWRAALPMGVYQTTPDGFYHPQLMGKRQPDWGTFFQGMIQNMYLIWEKDEQ